MRRLRLLWRISTNEHKGICRMCCKPTTHQLAAPVLGLHQGQGAGHGHCLCLVEDAWEGGNGEGGQEEGVGKKGYQRHFNV